VRAPGFGLLAELIVLLLASLAPAAAPAQSPSGSAAWSATSGAAATVYHRPQHAELAARVLAFLDEQPPLPALPADLPRDVSVYLASDEASFRERVGGRTPEWSAGVAIPALDRVVIPLYQSGTALSGERARVLRHEWAHLALHQHLEGLRIPRWFDEGYAEWAGGWDAAEGWRLRLLMAAGRTPPLDSLTLEWPRDAASAQVAYLLAATAVQYLVESSGERGLGLLLERWREDGDFEQALRSTYGVVPGVFETHWRGFVKRRYGWLLLVSNTLVLWLALGVLVLLLARVRRRRDRERLARLRAREGPDAPAYWNDGGSAGPERGGEPGPPG
jgi:hypothetical protein